MRDHLLRDHLFLATDDKKLKKVSELTQNLHCERSEAIQEGRHRKDWIATPPAEARN